MAAGEGEPLGIHNSLSLRVADNGLHDCPARLAVDGDALVKIHQINKQAAMAQRRLGPIMTASADRHLEPVVTGKANRCNDVLFVGRANNDSGSALGKSNDSTNSHGAIRKNSSRLRRRQRPCTSVSA